MINKINKLYNIWDSDMCYGKRISVVREGVFALEGQLKCKEEWSSRLH